MARLRLVHWNTAEAGELAARLKALGYTVDWPDPDPPAMVRELAETPPAAVVIDLSRLPSQGRDVGVLLRRRKGTRSVPLVYVGGEPEKVARVREVLPDATFTTWTDIGAALQGAIGRALAQPVVPESVFAPYAGKPLADKLGIHANMRVAMVRAPAGFVRQLGELPAGTLLVEGNVDAADLCLWFVRGRQELTEGMRSMTERIGAQPLWIAWPKKDSVETSDLVQQDVREAGLAAGLVDYKICSVDSTWSALLFRRRRVPGTSGDAGVRG